MDTGLPCNGKTMHELKNNILEIIIKKFTQWTAKETFFCHKGCSLCCTRNVMITAVEGRYIYNYILQQKKAKWLADKLLQVTMSQKINLTINGFARLCLEKKEINEDDAGWRTEESCPFLEENCCTIYTVRPFACRSFASTEDCHASDTAQISERLLVINTVTMQLLEHLGQKEYWGNMLDVLVALAGNKENKDVKKYINNDEKIESAINNTLTAEPVPGFLVKPDEAEEVAQYLHTVFSEKVGARTIEQIFNNK